MGRVRTPDPVAPLCAVTFRLEADRERAEAALSERLGVPVLAQAPRLFDHTRYYEKEMGTPLYKRILIFEGLMDPGELPDLKLFTNALEREGAEAGRRVNCDPGYVSGARVALASTKDFAHRLYLGRGIYGEVTLVVRDGRLAPLPWTYPDFREPATLDFLEGARRWYLDRCRRTPREG